MNSTIHNLLNESLISVYNNKLINEGQEDHPEAIAKPGPELGKAIQAMETELFIGLI